MTARWSGVALVAGGLTIAGVTISPESWGWIAYDGLALSCIAAMALGLRLNHPAAATAWWLLVAGVACFVGGDVLWDVLDQTGHTLEGFSVTDVVYLGGYPAMAVGAISLARRRWGGHDRDWMIDASVFCLATAFVGSQIFVRPVLDEGVLDQSVAASYPILDVVLLLLLARLATSVRDRTPALALLFAAALATGVGDVAYALAARLGEYSVDWIGTVPWLASYVLFAAAALHPSMVTLSQLAEAPSARVNRIRVALLAAALLTSPAVRLVRRIQGENTDAWELGALSVAMTVLVIWRLVSLVGQVDRAQSSLRASDERFRSLVQNASDMISIVGSDGRVLWTSPSVQRVLGWSPADLVGSTGPGLVHPEDHAEVERHFRLVVDEPATTRRFDIRTKGRDGNYRWIDTSITNRLDDPAVRGVVINARDVTAQREAADALRVRATQQEAVARIGQLALAGADPAMLTADAVTVVRHTLAVDGCLLFRLSESRDHLVLEAASGQAEDHTGRARFPVSLQTPAGVTLDSRTPVIVTDLPAETRLTWPTEALGVACPASTMSVPVTGRTRPYGVLLTFTAKARRFGADDAVFLQTAANALALALERRSAEDETRHQALHDALTGLPNRVLFLDRLEQALGRAERHRGGAAVLFLDLDHFKVVNDSLGHEAGDRLLTAVADRLRNLVRPGDTIARFGGDEFTMLCDDVALEDAVAVTKRLIAAMAEPFVVDGHPLHVSASIGIAIGQGSKEVAESLFRDADAAMYRAKDAGRDRFEVFDATIRDRVLTRLHTETALRRALSENELRVHYQPVVDLADGRLVGVEALLRWQRTDDDLVPPKQFVAIAEQTGLIDEIGMWVLNEVCRQVASWSEVPALAHVRAAVNLSARQLASPRLLSSVQAAIDDAGVHPDRLGFEITESALMGDVETSMAVLRRLKDLGLTLAVDDFGTGYSSLTYLKRLPVDILKVDRSFVQGLGQSNEDRAIVGAIVTLAHTMGMRAIAEGVELETQAVELRTLSCDGGQGFYFGYPGPPETILAAATQGPLQIPA